MGTDVGDRVVLMWCHCTLFSGTGWGHVVCEVIGGRGCLLYTSFSRLM